MPFYGRGRELARIKSELKKDNNIVLSGKFGIGKTSLVKEAAKLNRETWHFLFGDFSKTPSGICHDLLSELKPKGFAKKHIRDLSYVKGRSMIADLVSVSGRRCVIVLDNIEKLTSRKLELINYFIWDRRCLFIAVVENYLSDDGLLRLRSCLYPSSVIRLRYLSAGQTKQFFLDCATMNQIQWTESDIHMLTLATRGYPLGMKEIVTRELIRQK